MEPITTAIAAVTAASNAIAFIKARVNDVQSVAELGDQIGTLFSAQKKLNEEIESHKRDRARHMIGCVLVGVSVSYGVLL